MELFAQTQQKSRLGQILLDKRLVSQEQLSKAMEQQATTGERLGDILTQWNVVTQRHIESALRAQRTLRMVAYLATATMTPLMTGCGGGGGGDASPTTQSSAAQSTPTAVSAATPSPTEASAPSASTSTTGWWVIKESVCCAPTNNTTTASPTSVVPMTSTTPATATAPTPTKTVQNASGPEYFVSTNGNDANPGTLSQPWKTLNYAVKKLTPGEKLWVRGGTYAELVIVGNSGTAQAPITITAYPGETPVIDGSALVVKNWSSLLALAGSYIHVSGFEIKNININGLGGLNGATQVLGGFGIQIGGNNNSVSKMTVHDTWAQGVIIQGDNGILQDSSIYMVSMNNCRVNANFDCNGFAVPNPEGPSCVSAASTYGSGKTTRNAILQRNRIYNCWGEGLSTWLSDGTIIQDNIVYDNYAVNIYVNNATNALVQRNIVYNTPNNLVGNRTSGLVLSDEITTTTGPEVLSSNNTVINNLLYNARFCGFCWSMVPGSGLKNVVISYNTIINPGLARGFEIGGTSITPNIINTNSSIINNIVDNDAVSAPSSNGLTFSNNLWSISPPSAARSVTDVVGDPRIAATGGTGPGQLTANYMRPQSTSPAIRKGTALAQVNTDYFEHIITSQPDIGAIQR